MRSLTKNLCKVRRLSLVMSVFSALTKYRVVNIVHSSSEVVMRTMKHTVIYPGSDPSLEVIALCPTV
jgi:hypothetical protein